MGGLLARVYIARHRPKRLGRVVMLGTPNSGSEIADRLKNIGVYRAFFGPAGQQLGTQRDAAIEALFPPVDYPVGIIAGNRSIDPVAGTMLPKPHDGRVSVANTKLDGMADHVVVGTSHPWLVRNSVAVAQTIAFLQRWEVHETVAPSSPAKADEYQKCAKRSVPTECSRRARRTVIGGHVADAPWRAMTTITPSSAPPARSPCGRSTAASPWHNLPAAAGARRWGGSFRLPPIPSAP